MWLIVPGNSPSWRESHIIKNLREMVMLNPQSRAEHNVCILSSQLGPPILHSSGSSAQRVVLPTVKMGLPQTSYDSPAQTFSEADLNVAIPHWGSFLHWIQVMKLTKHLCITLWLQQIINTPSIKWMNKTSSQDLLPMLPELFFMAQIRRTPQHRALLSPVYRGTVLKAERPVSFSYSRQVVDLKVQFYLQPLMLGL